MTIGIPRALLYYYYFPLWRSLFTNLGHQVVVSAPTNGEMLEEGIKQTVSEICVPIKVYNSHVIELLKKDVDFIFVPRFVRNNGREWYCPKFLGLPELVKYSIPEAKEKMIYFDIHPKIDDTFDAKDFLPLCDCLNVSKRDLKNALKKANEDFLKFRAFMEKGYDFERALSALDGIDNPPPFKKGALNILLIGYVYNIYDPLVSMNIIQKLRDMNVNVYTFDMLNEKFIRNPKEKGKKIYWVFTRKIYNTVRRMLLDDEIDGIIHLTAFVCGPDSVVGKLFELDCDKYQKPFMTIRVDEHTGHGHLQTRIEAFVDMLKYKTKNAM